MVIRIFTENAVLDKDQVVLHKHQALLQNVDSPAEAIERFVHSINAVRITLEIVDV